jgi:hypothetical protein
MRSRIEYGCRTNDPSAPASAGNCALALMGPVSVNPASVWLMEA